MHKHLPAKISDFHLFWTEVMHVDRYGSGFCLAVKTNEIWVM